MGTFKAQYASQSQRLVTMEQRLSVLHQENAALRARQNARVHMPYVQPCVDLAHVPSQAQAPLTPAPPTQAPTTQASPTPAPLEAPLRHARARALELVSAPVRMPLAPRGQEVNAPAGIALERRRAEVGGSKSSNQDHVLRQVPDPACIQGGPLSVDGYVAPPRLSLLATACVAHAAPAGGAHESSHDEKITKLLSTASYWASRLHAAHARTPAVVHKGTSL